MAEKPCLQYSGQSMDELLACGETHRIDTIAMAFDEAICQRSNAFGLLVLSPEEQNIVAVNALEREVNNGGYHQFFLNEGQCAPIIVDALREIGCPKTATITEEAIDAMRLPRLTMEEIDKVIADENDARDKILSDCDDRFLDYTEDISGQLFAYIKHNRDAIRV